MNRHTVLGVFAAFLLVGKVWAEPKVEFVKASDVALENPHDLKLSADGRLLFVSDVGNNRVAILDP